jgi:prophage regulatory protein
MTANILRPQQAAEYLGVCRRHLYTLAEIDPTFPRKIVFTARCVGWRKESLDEWLKQKEEGVNL